MPLQQRAGQAGHALRLFGRAVAAFAGILAQVVELRLGTVVLAEQFPVALTHGQIRQSLRRGAHRFAIGRTAPKDRRAT